MRLEDNLSQQRPIDRAPSFGAVVEAGHIEYVDKLSPRAQHGDSAAGPDVVHNESKPNAMKSPPTGILACTSSLSMDSSSTAIAGASTKNQTDKPARKVRRSGMICKEPSPSDLQRLFAAGIEQKRFQRKQTTS